MRIREILFHDFRSFRGERRVSFVDPLTNAVRPVSVLAGSNGSGKTTLLEALEALLSLLLNPDKQPPKLINEVLESGLIVLTLEVSDADFAGRARDFGSAPAGKSDLLRIGVGKRELVSAELLLPESNRLCLISEPGNGRRTDKYMGMMTVSLRHAALDMQRDKADLHGGFIYFPYDRQLGVIAGGAIEPPPIEHDWLVRYSSANRWKGSLEQLWVWQNYLDLEQQAKGESQSGNLRRFVTAVEEVLGAGRAISVDEGRVQVPASWSQDRDPRVLLRLDQLPSGEQQVLLLFGELARRRRSGALIAIDEVENCLHPTLQRLVMWNLNRIAREWDAQIIVATHSLEVIRSVRGSAFINLDYPEDRFDLPAPDEAGESTQ